MDVSLMLKMTSYWIGSNSKAGRKGI